MAGVNSCIPGVPSFASFRHRLCPWEGFVCLLFLPVRRQPCLLCGSIQGTRYHPLLISRPEVLEAAQQDGPLILSAASISGGFRGWSCLLVPAGLRSLSWPRSTPCIICACPLLQRRRRLARLWLGGVRIRNCFCCWHRPLGLLLSLQYCPAGLGVSQFPLQHPSFRVRGSTTDPATKHGDARSNKFYFLHGVEVSRVHTMFEEYCAR